MRDYRLSAQKQKPPEKVEDLHIVRKPVKSIMDSPLTKALIKHFRKYRPELLTEEHNVEEAS